MIEIVEDFKNALRLFSTRTWRITGLEKESGQQMSIVYCGSDKHIEYISGKVFGANVDNKELIGRRPIMTIDRMLREWDCSIAIVTAPRWALSVIRKHGDLCIPWWIDCEIDCRSALGGGHTKSLQNDLRKIRKNELYFEKANQVEELRFFYDRIYAPTIHSSHGKAALPSSFEARKNQLRSGKAELLFVLRNGEVLGGILLDLRGKMPALRDIGVLDGNRELKKLAVITAGNYFGIEHLYSLGYEKVSMGLSRCFVDDGVFLYKQKWRPRFLMPSQNGFLFRVRKLDSVSRAFFGTLDCIEYAPDGLRRTRFSCSADSEPKKSSKLGSPSIIRGISESIWYNLSGPLPQISPTELHED